MSHFHIPPQIFGDKRPWAPWVEMEPDSVSLAALIADAIISTEDRVMHVPTVQLKWAHCDEETNLWHQFATPDRCVRAVYDIIKGRVPEISDASAAFDATKQTLSDIIDDPAAAGYGPADLPVLHADRQILTTLHKRIISVLKNIDAHTMGGRIMRTEIVGQITDTRSAPPTFSFRTKHIDGLPFMNGVLRSTTSYRQAGPDPTDRSVVPGITFVEYKPSDMVEVTRPIDREFDLEEASIAQLNRHHLAAGLALGEHPDITWDPVEIKPVAGDGVRPFGWDWLVRGFLGLNRSADPPPYQARLDSLNTDSDIEWELWRAWYQGGSFSEPNGVDHIFDGYPAPSDLLGVASDSDVLDWFDRLLAATLFANDDAPFKKIPFIFGASNTGKSTLFNIVQQLIGDLYGHITISALLNTRSLKDTSQLLGSVMGRRFVTPSSEIPANAQWRSEVVKAYVGNDQLLAERKYENPVAFRPQGGMWVAGNHYLSHEDRDDSMANRLIYLVFHQPSGRRLSPGEVRSLVDSEADDILTHLAMVHARMRCEYEIHRDPSYWSDKVHSYPTGYAPDLDLIESETDPWAGLFEECFRLTGNDSDAISNDDLYAIFRRWAMHSEGIQMTQVPTRSQFVARVLKNRPGISQGRVSGGGARTSKGIQLTPTGQSHLMDSRS